MIKGWFRAKYPHVRRSGWETPREDPLVYPRGGVSEVPQGDVSVPVLLFYF